MLAGETEEFSEVAARITHSDSPRYFNVLLAAAFHAALLRRFRQGYSLSGVIRFVADQRSRTNESADDFDPTVAEQLVLSALTGELVAAGDEKAKADAQIALLLGAVEDEHLDDAGLDEFVEEARRAAERAMPRFEHLVRGPA